MRRGRHALGGIAALAAAVALGSPVSAWGATTQEGIFFASAPPVASELIFDEGGLEIRATCAAGPASSVELRTEVDNATVDVMGRPTAGYSENDDFDVAEVFSMFAAVGGDGNFDGGRIVYSRPDGTHVTVDWSANEDPIPFPDQCVFAGIAHVAAPGAGGSGSRKRIDFRALGGDAATTVLDAGGLRLRASCVEESPTESELGLVARADEDGGAIFAGGQQAATILYADDKRFAASESFRPLDELIGSDDSAISQLVYVSPSRDVVTVEYTAEEADAYGGQTACQLVGTARVAPKGSQQHALFAKRRAQAVPEPKRGIPEPEPKRFYELGPFHLRAACGTSMALDHALFPEVEASDGHDHSFMNEGPNGSEDSFGSSLGEGTDALAFNPKRLVGHSLDLLASGDLLLYQYATSERQALGKRCLLAGIAEYEPGPAP